MHSAPKEGKALAFFINEIDQKLIARNLNSCIASKDMLVDELLAEEGAQREDHTEQEKKEGVLDRAKVARDHSG